jgi:hypothetical protein
VPHNTAKIPHLLHRLYRIVDELEHLFPGRHFTPDGHLVGSLGEVWAAYYYGLQLASASTKGYDGVSPDGRRVQVKATQGRSVALRSAPSWLIVLQLQRDGSAVEVYNGPGAPAWRACGKMAKNGQRQVRLSALEGLMAWVPERARLPRIAS